MATLTDNNTAATDTPEFDNSNEAGAIWIGKDKNGNEKLGIVLNGHSYQAYPNRKKDESKPEDAKKPDYNVVEYEEDGKTNLVGAAWVGKTKNDRAKLTIKMSDGTYYTAVMRDRKEDEPEDSKRADMTIFKPSTQAAE